MRLRHLPRLHAPNVRDMLFIVLVAVRAVAPIAGQSIDMDAAQAREEFRWGVQAYHATRYNDAIVAFNRTLSFQPDNFAAREWLGRAYLRSGFVDAALSEWRTVVDNDAAGAYLINRIETFEYRQGVLPFVENDVALSRSQMIAGRRGETNVFRRPGGLAAHPNGDIFAVSLGTQELLRMTPNGRVRAALRGGLVGLSQPFDVALHEGELFVSEFGRDRIAVLTERGDVARTFGSPGLAEGELLGPQYLAVDETGAVFVTEWGTRRVTKFDRDGTFILTFGTPSPFFRGLERPTGIAARDGRIYVADADRDGVAIHVFDPSGNHLRRIPMPLTRQDAPEESLSGAVIEDLDWFDENHLLIAAGNRVLIMNPVTETIVSEVADAERQRVSSMVRDANGRVVVSDFDANELVVFEPEGVLYAGLDVRIERIVARDYPNVAMQVAVFDRDGAPLVGLQSENFVVSEMGIPRPDAEVAVAGQQVETLETALILQPRAGQSYVADVGRAVGDLAALLPGGDELSVYAAGVDPEMVVTRPASAERFAAVAAEAIVARDQLFARDQVRLDRAIRLAAGQLADRGLRRNLIVVGDGLVGDRSFDEIGLQELSAYLVNNGIRLHVVTVQQGSISEEFAFLVEETGGTVRYLYEPEGLAPLVSEMRSAPSGRYWLTVVSQQDPDFGRRYIPMSVEARLFVRSGRDELGFFPPESP